MDLNEAVFFGVAGGGELFRGGVKCPPVPNSDDCADAGEFVHRLGLVIGWFGAANGYASEIESYLGEVSR